MHLLKFGGGEYKKHGDAADGAFLFSAVTFKLFHQQIGKLRRGGERKLFILAK